MYNVYTAKTRESEDGYNRIDETTKRQVASSNDIELVSKMLYRLNQQADEVTLYWVESE